MQLRFIRLLVFLSIWEKCSLYLLVAMMDLLDCGLYSLKLTKYKSLDNCPLIVEMQSLIKNCIPHHRLFLKIASLLLGTPMVGWESMILFKEILNWELLCKIRNLGMMRYLVLRLLIRTMCLYKPMIISSDISNLWPIGLDWHKSLQAHSSRNNCAILHSHLIISIF